MTIKNRLRKIRHELKIDKQIEMARLLGLRQEQYNIYELQRSNRIGKLRQKKRPRFEVLVSARYIFLGMWITLVLNTQLIETYSHI